MMNIPYADFYQGEGDSDVDATSSATMNKAGKSLGYGAYHASDLSSIKGVTYPVQVNEAVLDKYTETFIEIDTSSATKADDGTYTNGSTDILNTIETDYAYYEMDKDPSNYKTLTVDENGNMTFSSINGDVTDINVDSTFKTSSSYGDYELDITLPENITNSIVNAVVLKTSDGASYGLRHIENIWKNSQLAWSTGHQTTSKGCTLSYEDYQDMEGKTITNVVYYTSVGVYNLTLNTSAFVSPYYTEDITVNASDTKTVLLSNLPEDIKNAKVSVYIPGSKMVQPVYAVENAEIVDGKVTLTQAMTLGTEYTVAVESDNYATIVAKIKPAMVMMNIPYAQFYAGEGDSDVDVTSSATKTKTTGNLATGSYHAEDGSSVKGVTYPVFVGNVNALDTSLAVSTEDESYIKNEDGSYSYAGTVKRGAVETTYYSDILSKTESDYAYYVMDTTSLPSNYKVLGINNGKYTFGAIQGDVNAATVKADFTTETNYGDYQLNITLPAAITDSTVVNAVLLKTSDGSSYGLRHVENIWRQSMLAWSTGHQTTSNGCTLSYEDYQDMEGKTITSVVYYTSAGVYELTLEQSAYVAPYYTLIAMENGDKEIDLCGLPNDIDVTTVTVKKGEEKEVTRNGKTTTQIVYTEVESEYKDGVVTLKDSLDATSPYQVTVTSTNYATATSDVNVTGDLYIQMNLPYSSFYENTGTEQQTTSSVDGISTATTSKFKGTTGLANGTYNDGTSIKGVVFPIKVSLETYKKLEATGVKDDTDYGYSLITTTPEVYKELQDVTVNEKNQVTYTFSDVQGTTIDASNVSVDAVQTDSSYGDYEITLNGVTTGKSGTKTINGDTYNTIYGMIVTTTDNQSYAMYALDNMWFGTKTENVEVAWSVTNGKRLCRGHGAGDIFYQYDMNGKTIQSVQLITDAGIYNVSCQLDLPEYYDYKAVQTSDTEIKLTDLPDDIMNAKASVYYEEGSGKSKKTIYVAQDVEIQDGKVTCEQALDSNLTYYVEVTSDNYASKPVEVEEMVYVTMNIPYSVFYENENAEAQTQSEVDGISTATTNKFKGTTGLADATYNDGSVIKGVTYPVAMDLETYDALKGKDLFNKVNENYGYTTLYSKPSVYKVLTIQDGQFKFSEFKGETYTTSNVTVSEPITTGSYGDYQIDLEGVTTDTKTIDGQSYNHIYGVVLSTSDGNNYDLYTLDNIWLGTRVPNVEIAWSVKGGKGLKKNHNNAEAEEFYQYDMNGKTLTSVKVITDVGIFTIPCETKLPAYYSYSAMQDAKGENITFVGLPEDLENAKASVYYKEGSGKSEKKVYVTQNATIKNGKVALPESLNSEKTYYVDVVSDNYAQITEPVQKNVILNMNIPYSVFYENSKSEQQTKSDVDGISTATTNKFKDTTGLANGTYNDGSSMKGVTFPVSVDAETYDQLDSSLLGATKKNYGYQLNEENVKVYKTLTIENGQYKFSDFNVEAKDTQNVQISEYTTSSSYGDYQITLEGVTTGKSGSKTIDGEAYNTIYGMVVTTTDGQNYAMYALDNMWFGTKTENVEVAWSVKNGKGLKKNHDSADEAFYQYDMNGKTIKNVQLITDAGIYNVAANLKLDPYFSATADAFSKEDEPIQSIKIDLPSDIQNAKATVSVQKEVEVTNRDGSKGTKLQYQTISDAYTNLEVKDGVITLPEGLDADGTYQVTIQSDNYASKDVPVNVHSYEVNIVKKDGLWYVSTSLDETDEFTLDDSVKVDNIEVVDPDCVIDDGVATFSEDYIDDLMPGNHVVTLSYKNKNGDVVETVDVEVKKELELTVVSNDDGTVTWTINISKDNWDSGSLKVDGKTVESASYKVADGSTVITLQKAYVSALSSGEHTLNTTFFNGEVEVSDVFKTSSKTSSNTTSGTAAKSTSGTSSTKSSASTGIQTNVFGYISTMTVALLSGLLALRKKKEK